MLGPLLSRCRGAVGSPRQRAIVMVLRHLNMRGRRPEQTLCLRCRPNGGRVVLSKEAGLQLADPIIAGGNRQTRIALEVLFEPAFVVSKARRINVRPVRTGRVQGLTSCPKPR